MRSWLFNAKNPSKLFRALARCVDYLLLFIIGSTVSLFLPWFIETYVYFIFALAAPLIWAPIEAWLISMTGTTPGKALFGIKVLDPQDRKMSYWESLKVAAGIGSAQAIIQQASLSLKRRLTALMLIVACALMSIFGDTITKWTIGFERGISKTGWVEYADVEGGFKVYFPNNPKEESKQVEIPKTDKVLNYQEIQAHQNKKIFYSVTYMELPRKWKIAGTSRLLKAGLDILVKHMPNAVLINKEFTKHQGNRSLDFELRQGDNEVKGRLILVGTTLYKLTMTYPISLEQEVQEDNPFLDSFNLSGTN